MMKRTYVAFMFVLTLLLLTACGRSPSANLYTLDSSNTGMVPTIGDPSEISVGIRQVSLPPVLSRPQIVLIEGERVRPQEYHRWSEPLDEAMLRILSYELRARLNSSLVLSYPWPTSFNPEQVLSIRVARFSGLPGKNVELVGVWILSQGGDSPTIRTERFHIVEKVEERGYSALVRAHSGALNQLAEQLSKALTVQQ